MVSRVLFHFSAYLGRMPRSVRGLFSLQKLATMSLISDNFSGVLFCFGFCLFVCLFFKGFFPMVNMFFHWELD